MWACEGIAVEDSSDSFVVEPQDLSPRFEAMAKTGLAQNPPARENGHCLGQTPPDPSGLGNTAGEGDSRAGSLWQLLEVTRQQAGRNKESINSVAPEDEVVRTGTDRPRRANPVLKRPAAAQKGSRCTGRGDAGTRTSPEGPKASKPARKPAPLKRAALPKAGAGRKPKPGAAKPKAHPTPAVARSRGSPSSTRNARA